MTIEAQLDRIIELLEANVATLPAAATPTPAAATSAPSTRRRRATAEPAPVAQTPADTVSPDSQPADTSSVPTVATALDPFDTVPAVVVTDEEVWAAARALSAATTQANAVAVLKAATGASSRGDLRPEQYATALSAFQKAMPLPVAAAAADPFAATTGAAAAPTAAPPASAVVQTDAPSLDDVKTAIRNARKRTGDAKVQAIVIEFGGKAVDPADGTIKVSINALPISQYANAITRLNALPDTKTGK